jgi:hypothetical protein
VYAGAGGAALVDDLEDPELVPTGGATLDYKIERGTAAASYTHGANLNPYLRQTLISDDVVLRGGLPIGGTRWVITGAIGYQHAKTILSQADATTTTLDVFSIDADFAYQISPTMDLGIRYQFADQEGDSELAPDLVRNALSVTFVMRYPDQTRTVLPFKQPLRMLRDPTLGDGSRPRPR